jgi:hypothetical protein
MQLLEAVRDLCLVLTSWMDVTRSDGLGRLGLIQQSGGALGILHFVFLPHVRVAGREW